MSSIYSYVEMQETYADYLKTNQNQSHISMKGMDPTGEYVYAFPDGSKIGLSVPVGALTNETVKITLTDGMTVINQLKNGVPSFDTSMDTFAEDGTYQLRVMRISDQKDAQGNPKTFHKDISFQIRNKTSQIPDVLSSPEGFSLITARKDGMPVRDFRSTVFFDQEGTYELRYQSDECPGVYYDIEVVRDHTSPEIILPEPRIDGTYQSPMTFSVTEKDCRVYLMDHGNKVLLENLVLNGAGEHVLMVEDPYGNRSSKAVKIHKNSLSISEILTASGILCLIVYMVWLRFSKEQRNTR